MTAIEAPSCLDRSDAKSSSLEKIAAATAAARKSQKLRRCRRSSIARRFSLPLPLPGRQRIYAQRQDTHAHMKKEKSPRNPATESDRTSLPSLAPCCAPSSQSWRRRNWLCRRGSPMQRPAPAGARGPSCYGASYGHARRRRDESRREKTAPAEGRGPTIQERQHDNAGGDLVSREYNL